MNAELIVSTIFFSSTGRVLVEGMCSQGILRVGDKLRDLKLKLVKTTYEGMEDAGESPIGSLEGLVEKIEAYGEQLDELDRGVSARITVSVKSGSSVVWNVAHPWEA